MGCYQHAQYHKLVPEDTRKEPVTNRPPHSFLPLRKTFATPTQNVKVHTQNVKTPTQNVKAITLLGLGGRESLLSYQNPLQRDGPFIYPGQNPLDVFSTFPGCYFRMLDLSVVQIEQKHRVYSEK